MIRHDRPFDLLEPPPGGIAGLRGKLAARRRRRRGGAAAVLLLVALTAAGLTEWYRPSRTPRIAFGPSGVRFGWVGGPAESVVVTAERRGDLAVREVPVRDPRVRLYLLARVSEGQEPPALPDPESGPSDADGRSRQVNRKL